MTCVNCSKVRLWFNENPQHCVSPRVACSFVFSFNRRMAENVLGKKQWKGPSTGIRQTHEKEPNIVVIDSKVFSRKFVVGLAK